MISDIIFIILQKFRSFNHMCSLWMDISLNETFCLSMPPFIYFDIVLLFVAIAYCNIFVIFKTKINISYVIIANTAFRMFRWMRRAFVRFVLYWFISLFQFYVKQNIFWLRHTFRLTFSLYCVLYFNEKRKYFFFFEKLT